MRERRRAKADLIGFLREDWLIRKGIYSNRLSIPLTRTVLPNGDVVYKHEDYFNWIYYVPSDIVGVTSPPIIYDGGVPISSANYDIHFMHGELSLDNTPSGAVTADFAHLHYAVIESEDSLFDLKDSPFSYIVIQNLTCQEEAMQLGGGVLQNYGFILEISSYHRQSLSIARARTDDVVEYIKRGLDVVAFIDYTTNLPLDANGDRIAAYDRAVQLDGYYGLREDTVVDTEIPNYEDSRELARHSLSFTLIGSVDTLT